MIDKSKLRKYSAGEIENSFDLSTVEDFVKLSDVESLLATTASTEPASRGAAQGRITSDNGASPVADVGGLTPQLHADLRLAWKLVQDAGHEAAADRIFAFLASPAPSAKQEPAAAYMHADGRVVPAATMDAARRDGGAMASSLRDYTIELVPRTAAPSASASPAAPGFVLVPVKPTFEMIRAAENCEGRSTGRNMESPSLIYAAMLAAAPAVPVPVEQGWISVEDARRPEKAEVVLVAVRYIRYSEDENGRDEHEGYEVTEGEYMPKNDEGGDYFTSFSSPHGDQEWITHWMPLPASPSLQQGKEGAAS